MKQFLASILCAIGMMFPAAADDAPWVVQATVIELPLAPNSGPDVDPPNQQNPPVWHAVLRIDRVFSGPNTLKGSKFTASTSSEQPLGNSRPIVPKLIIGDVGIFAIHRAGDDQLYHLYTPPMIEEGLLPLIKGRDVGYEKALERLSGESVGNAGSTTDSEMPKPAAPSEDVGKDTSRHRQDSAVPVVADSKAPAGSSGSSWWLWAALVCLLVAALMVFRLRAANR